MSAKKDDLSWRSALGPRPVTQNPIRSQIYAFDEDAIDTSPDVESDGVHDKFQSSRNLFETWQQKKSSPRALQTQVSDELYMESPDGRIDSFSSLKKRFQGDPNDDNNNSSQTPPRSMKYASYTVPPSSRQSWDGGSSEGSRRSSSSSVEYGDREKVIELTEIREQVAILKRELAEAQSRRQTAVEEYPGAKQRIVTAKEKSSMLRDKSRSVQYQIERREYKTKEKKKRLEVKNIEIEQNERSAAFYSKDIQKESDQFEKVSEEMETTRARRKATSEKIREIAKRIGPLKKKIVAAENRMDNARERSRKSQDILNKTTIKLKQAREMSVSTAQRISFKGYRLEDAGREVEKAQERIKRAKSDISYLKYRKKLSKEQLQEYQDDLHKLLVRLGPKQRQKACGSTNRRNMPYPSDLPMSEEL